MRVFFCLLVLAVSMAVFTASAESSDAEGEPAPPVLIVGYVEFPPFIYTNEQGEAVGHLNELTQEIAEHAGIRLRFSEMPASRLEHDLRAGRVHLTPWIRSLAENDDAFIVGDQVLLSIELAVYQRMESEPFHSVADLKGVKVGVLRGYRYEGLYDRLDNAPDTELMVFNSRSSAYRALIRNRVDYFLDYMRPGQVALEDLAQPAVRETQVASFDIYWLMPDMPWAEQVLEQLEASHAALQEEKGTLITE